MDLWDKFRAMNPLWDQFRFMGIFKKALYAFLPHAERIAPNPDLGIPLVAKLSAIMDDLRDNCKKLNRDNDRVLKPITKIGLGIISGDPAYLNYAMAIVAKIQATDFEFTDRQKAWLKARFGTETK